MIATGRNELTSRMRPPMAVATPGMISSQSRPTV